MGGNAEKTKFSIRVDTDLVELADTYIWSSTVKKRTELIENALSWFSHSSKGGRLSAAVVVIRDDRNCAG